MNILILTAYPPVLHMHGGGVRMFHNIRILASQHKVRLISFIENDQEAEILRPLEGICESVTAVRRIPDFRPHWLSVAPFLVREFSTPAMYQAVEKEFERERIDVLQCEYLQMAQFHRRGVFSILTLHEMLSANAYEAFSRASDPFDKLRLYYRWMQLLRYEAIMPKRFDRVVTMTGHDADYLRSYVPSADIRPIPIGIDPVEFSPKAEEDSRPVEILFVGNFRHQPNVEAAEFLVREIAPHFEGVQFVIPGSVVPEHLAGNSGVSFPGYIPDTRVLYHRPNTIVVAPLFSGTGQRVKLLEAFSMACPVVTSSIGALGFPVTNGAEALIADTGGDFVRALRTLVSSKDLRTELGHNARAMILRDFTWEKIGKGLLGLMPAPPGRALD